MRKIGKSSGLRLQPLAVVILNPCGNAPASSGVARPASLHSAYGYPTFNILGFYRGSFVHSMVREI
jgi:hypothetical protein